MLAIINLKIRIEEYKEDLGPLVEEKLRLSKGELLAWKLVKRSLDARKKPDLSFQLQVEAELTEPAAARLLKKGKIQAPAERQTPQRPRGNRLLNERPIIIGAGPAGIFCAWKLARAGLRPLVLERGAQVEERIQAVERFLKSGEFNERTNIAFGEGGAGTFSDGKLTSRSKSPLVAEVYRIMAAAGAPEQILYQHNPHLGTDGLRKIVTTLRHQIEQAGGEILFGTKLEAIGLEGQRATTILLEDGRQLPVSLLILATGHSARDTTRMLLGLGIPAEVKPFSIGARIEHEATFINNCQYGREDDYTRNLLGNSEYHLTYKGEKGVYSFCMCPGGLVVPSNSFPGEVVTNGMSYASRAAKLSNSAIVATVGEGDYGSTPEEALAFQELIERKAYAVSGSYKAIGQNCRDFIEGTASTEVTAGFKPSYRPGIILGNLEEILPPQVCRELKNGLLDFDRKLPGFIDKGFLTGPETRTSSPVRILRDEKARVLGYNNLYAIGEGAGYAGGIVSSAIDGLRLADEIESEYIGVDRNG